MRKVLIGVQCRMNSERLPGKALLKIGGKTIIEHVLAQCRSSASYINKQGRYDTHCQVVLLVPRGDDELIRYMKNKIDIIEGPENDVITRYVKAVNSSEYDYVVRITGDCLYITNHAISRHIKYALQREDADYVNNVLQRCNPEGWDTEVISRRLLDWLDQNATTGEDREHVTTYIPKAIQGGYFPKRFKIYTSKDHIDLSHIKTSIDTPEDYELALQEFEIRKQKIAECRKFGEVF